MNSSTTAALEGKYMSHPLKFAVCIMLLFLGNLSNHAQDVWTNGKICGLPSAPCRGFQKYDLSFRLPEKLKWQTNYRSAYFYAVILKSRAAVREQGVDDDKCKQGYFSESERLGTQRDFPANKVFTSRNGCYGAWGNAYTNVNYAYEFIAVYGGETQAEANAVLTAARNKGFRDANIRRMQVILQFGD